MTKTLNRIIAILALFLAIVALFFIRERLVKNYPPEGFQLIAITTLDSLNQLPDTIVKDTVIYRDTTIYRYISHPETKVQDSALNEAKDSLITPFYTVWITSWIKDNAVIKNEWSYTDPDRIKIKETIYVPKFYSVPIESKIDPSGLYLGGGLSYPFGFKLGLNYLYKGKIYGLDLGYIKNTAYIAVDYKVKF